MNKCDNCGQSIPESKYENPVILVAQRGWVLFGDLSTDDEFQILSNAKVVRSWGTTAGIGEIALNGPTPKTVLDNCGMCKVRKGVEVLIIPCNKLKWL